MAEPMTDEDLEYLIRDHHEVYDRGTGASGCAAHCADYLFPDGCLTSRLATETLRQRKAIAKVKRYADLMVKNADTVAPFPEWGAWKTRREDAAVYRRELLRYIGEAPDGIHA